MRHDEVELSLWDVMILLRALYQGASDSRVGFEDSEKTIDEIRKALSARVVLPKDAVESALWSANQLAERGDFWNPRCPNFIKWLDFAFSVHNYNTDYGWLEEKQ